MVKHIRQRSAESEISMVARIRRLAEPGVSKGAIVLGIGDDCAVYRPPGSPEDLLFTTDLLLEGTHFRRDTHRPQDVGWKALARGLSDIAAMGGSPRFCLVSLALPRGLGDGWVDGFYHGLLRLARRERTPLVGGDLGCSRRVVCDIVVCGAVPRGQALRRDGARPGDLIYVSGALGGSALGLARKMGKSWRRHLAPEPRLSLGRQLRRWGATASMDLSDGLSLDLHRLCLASGLQAELSAPPVFPGASLAQALHGGEDYELLFTAPGARVPAAFQGIGLTPIGIMQKGRAGAVRMDGRPLAPRGWDHFRGGRNRSRKVE
jgi:thiamine-monophosphate kinase